MTPEETPADVLTSPMWRRVGLFNLSAVFVMAFVYLGLQWQRNGGFADALFVGLILANAVTAFRVGVFLQPRVAKLFDLADDAVDGLGAIRAVFDSPLTIPAMILYAAVLGGGVALIAPWEEPALNRTLIGFVFAGNLIIGQALWAMVMYWRAMRRLVGGMEMSILHLTRPEIVLVQSIAVFITVSAALIAMLGVASILLSTLVINPIVWLFSVCAFLVVISTYVVAIEPLATRLRGLKTTELSRLDEAIEAYHRKALGKGEAPEGVGDLETLLLLRDRVGAVRCFPPNGEFSLSTILSVTFLSFLPALVDYAMTLITQS